MSSAAREADDASTQDENEASQAGVRSYAYCAQSSVRHPHAVRAFGCREAHNPATAPRSASTIMMYTHMSMHTTTECACNPSLTDTADMHRAKLLQQAAAAHGAIIEPVTLDIAKQCAADASVAGLPRARQLVKVVVERLREEGAHDDADTLRAVRNLARVPALRADLSNAGAVEAVVRHLVACSTTKPQLSAGSTASTARISVSELAYSRSHPLLMKESRDVSGPAAADDARGSKMPRAPFEQTDVAVDAVGLDVGSTVGMAVYAAVEAAVLAVGSAIGTAVGTAADVDDSTKPTDGAVDLESGKRTRQGVDCRLTFKLACAHTFEIVLACAHTRSQFLHCAHGGLAPRTPTRAQCPSLFTAVITPENARSPPCTRAPRPLTMPLLLT